jgi:hypothetical protein
MIEQINDRNGSRAIFAFRYKSYNESPVFKVYITLFYQEDKDEEWKWKNLYQDTLTGIEDEYIR